jgi:sulfide:quinone oxidoreductase
VIDGIEAGRSTRLAFVLPPGPVWPLPLYELALLTAKRAHQSGRTVQMSFVLSGPRPLEALGEEAGDVMTALLADAGITLFTDTDPIISSPRRMVLQPSNIVLESDRIISLPSISGPNIRGIPGFAQDRFLHVDEYCRVLGTQGRIFAAGDATDLPVKQGGVGAQQADVAAAGIAHLAGVAPPAERLRAQINATLLTGDASLYLSAYLIDGQGWQASFYDQPPWPAEQKVIAEELGPYIRTLDVTDSDEA